MAISQQDLQRLIATSLPNSIFEIIDMVGDEDHYQLTIFDPSFIGKTLINQHKIVNNALKEILGTQLHALKIITKTTNFTHDN